MNGAQIAHYLKIVGKGKEVAGITAIYRTGMLVGAGQAIVGIAAAYVVYCIGKWGYGKLMTYLQQNGYIGAAGDAV
ncbi:MAG: hypothetical protein IJ088_03335 [Clostridia bacterium]|nr:hypothetical protein [Clostridia bacterium]